MRKLGRKKNKRERDMELRVKLKPKLGMIRHFAD